LGLWSDEQVAGTAKLVNVIKDIGAAAVVQINHAGPRCVPLGGELQGASPSGIAFRPDVNPIVLTPDQIHQIVTDFADAAERAAEAGYDGVEIHGAHFYLISQFLSPLTNKRDDRYGGDAKGRAAMALEAVKAIRERLGKSYPILFRFNAVERIEGGQTTDDALTVCKLLKDEGVDVLDVSLVAGGGWKEEDGKSRFVGSSALSKKKPAGDNIPLTTAVKKEVDLPIIAVGKLGEGNVAEETVRDTPIELVAIGRQMIADPDSATKILSGRHRDINACIECLTCFATIGRGDPMGCKVNENLPGTP
jgi:2,4-dienoyl-CoA reductase-like NADH-dependent reductase (Old Yellow Enzyme family)